MAGSGRSCLLPRAAPLALEPPSASCSPASASPRARSCRCAWFTMPSPCSSSMSPSRETRHRRPASRPARPSPSSSAPTAPSSPGSDPPARAAARIGIGISRGTGWRSSTPSLPASCDCNGSGWWQEVHDKGSSGWKEMMCSPSHTSRSHTVYLTGSRPRSSLHTVAYGFRRWIPRRAARHGLPRRHQPMMAHLCLSSPCHESCRLTRSSWFTSSRTTPSNLIVRRTSCPIWGSKATTHNSDLQLQMKGTTTHHAAPLEDDGLYSSKVGVQELQEKNPEENPGPSMCFSSLELVMLIFSCIL